MKIDCSLCTFSKYIHSCKVLENHCRSCKEKNYIFYKPEILDTRSILGYDIEDIRWKRINEEEEDED